MFYTTIGGIFRTLRNIHDRASLKRSEIHFWLYLYQIIIESAVNTLLSSLFAIM